jgi:hypothetical protein
MKRHFFIATVIISAVCGCNKSGAPKLEVNVESINFCNQAPEERAVWNNLQLRNVGRGTLDIFGIRIRGDEGCAFSCEYSQNGELVSCPNENDNSVQPKISIDEDTTLLVRIEYMPSSSETEDSAALVIESNAENLGTGEEKTELLVLPMCGNGNTAAGAGDAGDETPDGGLSDGGASAALEDCGACETVPEKGAPSCSDRS